MLNNCLPVDQTNALQARAVVWPDLQKDCNDVAEYWEIAASDQARHAT
jgi:hypothetical protein